MGYKRHTIYGKNLDVEEIENCLLFLKKYIEFLSEQKKLLRLQKRRICKK